MSVSNRLLEQSAFYRAWQAPFVEQKLRPIRERGDIARARRVLDVGCGPGTNAPSFKHADYLGVDINPRYIADARRRFSGRFEVADVTSYSATNEGRFDFILVNSLLHHIETTKVRQLLAHLGTLLSEDGHIHIIDLVLPPRRSIPRRLALMDRGDFPRPLSEWAELFQESLNVIDFEAFSVGIGKLALWDLVYCRARSPKSAAAR